jgi:Tfp pilus assembly protein PilV
MPELRQPANRRACPHPERPCVSRPAGFALHETLCALIVLGTGLLPAMGMAPKALGQMRELDALARATRLAVEMAEVNGAQPALQSERQDLWLRQCAGTLPLQCPDNAQLVMAGRRGGPAGIPSIALWVLP